jgi:hypothetical protein
LNYINRRNYTSKGGGVKWILEGDSNTCYFHSIANGRRRKCRIEFLETGQGRIVEQELLVSHIYEFYRKLFGREERGKIRMATRMWKERGRLSRAQQESIVRPFTMEEVEIAI